MLAALIEEAVHAAWPREGAIAYVLEHHTWEKRAREYADIIHRAFGS